MKALVLAGGYDQIALIDELKRKGYYVVLADYYENPIAKSVADMHYQISTLDVEKIKEVALLEKVDIVTTACTDQALLTVAKVSEELGLSCYLDFETARNVTNKEYMKSKFVDNDIPTARHIIVDKVDGLMGKLTSLKFPLIVKPVDCNSSKGVVKVENSISLFEAVENAINYSRTTTAVIEEFVDGKEYTVDFWIDNGNPRLLMASEIIKVKNRKTFTICGCQTLPELSKEKEQKLEEIASKIAKAFNLDNMPMFMQVIDDGEDIKVLEFSARMGGGTKYRMIELYSGVPIMEMYVERVLGKFPTLPSNLTKKKMLLSFIYCQKGKFTGFDGIGELVASGVVREWYQYKSVGSEFDKAENSGDRVAGMLLIGDTENELVEKQKILYEKLVVCNDNGDNMLLSIL